MVADPLFYNHNFLITYARSLEFLAVRLCHEVERAFFDEEGQRLLIKNSSNEIAEKINPIIQALFKKTEERLLETVKGYRLIDSEGKELPFQPLFSAVRLHFASEMEEFNYSTRFLEPSYAAKLPTAIRTQQVDEQTWKELLKYQYNQGDYLFNTATDMDLYSAHNSNRNGAGGWGRDFLGTIAGVMCKKLSADHKKIHEEAQNIRAKAKGWSEVPCSCFIPFNFEHLNPFQKKMVCKGTLGSANGAIEKAVDTARVMLSKQEIGADINPKKNFDITQGNDLHQQLSDIVDPMFKSLQMTPRDGEKAPPIVPLNISEEQAMYYSVYPPDVAKTTEEASQGFKFLYNALQLLSSSDSKAGTYKTIFSAKPQSESLSQTASIPPALQAHRVKLLSQLVDWSALLFRISELAKREEDAVLAALRSITKFSSKKTHS
jgi:hypothetical protein